MPDSRPDEPVSACPACGARETRRLLHERGRDVVRCTHCGLAFLHPFPAVQELAEIYSGSYYARDDVYAASLSREIAGTLRRLLPSGRILDVGSGAGEFLELARGAGYEVHGLDTSESARFHSERSGIPFTKADLTTLDAGDGSFDAITMWDVIEHLTEPRAYLAAARRLLRPGGVLVIKTPDIQASVMALAKMLSRFRRARGVLGYPAHLLYFDARSLRRLIEEAGFEILDARHLGSLRSARPGTLRARAYRLVVRAMERVGAAGNLLYYARRSLVD